MSIMSDPRRKSWDDAKRCVDYNGEPHICFGRFNKRVQWTEGAVGESKRKGNGDGRKESPQGLLCKGQARHGTFTREGLVIMVEFSRVHDVSQEGKSVILG